MSGPTDPFDATRPVSSDSSAELPPTLRGIKGVLVSHESTLQTQATRLSQLGNAADRNIFVSTSLPTSGQGVNGDIWLQVDE